MKKRIVLVLNSGSSSLKFQVFDATESEKLLAKGLAERIGMPDATFTMTRHDGQSIKETLALKDHVEALNLMRAKLTDGTIGVLHSLNDVTVIGHRVVHGGEHFRDAAVVTEEVKKAIENCIPLAPLHNPANLVGIDACERAFGGVPNVAVFDTAFHATMPPASYLYAIPFELYKKYGIRKYGFHGSSHKYVAESTAAFLGRPLSTLKLITCHLGNGSSVAAIAGGQVLDTSMGMTPLPGLVMGSRSGDIDPAVVIYLARQGMSIDEIDNLLNKKSGLLGVGTINSGDMRDIVGAAAANNDGAARALDMFVHRLAFYIGAYHTLLGGADVIVFTGGIGENGDVARGRVAQRLWGLGVRLDAERNKVRGQALVISRDSSAVKLLVMPTNEELMIARESLRVLKNR